MESLRGQLLVASPTLLDPNFARTVVLIAEHSDEGALGLVLNRPTPATVGEATPDLEPLADDEQPVFVGGPVRPETVLVLAQFDETDAAGMLAFDDVGFLPPEPDLELIAAATRRVRVFAGHAGWGPGQLDSELEREDWILAPADADTVFAERAEDLWGSVLARKGGHYALVARMPLDPSVN